MTSAGDLTSGTGFARRRAAARPRHRAARRRRPAADRRARRVGRPRRRARRAAAAASTPSTSSGGCRDELLAEVADDEGTAMRLCSRARRERGARPPPRAAPRAVARADRPDAGLRPAPRRTPCARRLLTAVGADPHADRARRRRCRTRRRSTRCAWSTAGTCCGWPSRDLAHHVGVDDAAAEISDLAAGDPRRRRWPSPAPGSASAAHAARLAVIAMGKCGGHELNYVSDVDVIFVHEPVERGRRRTTASPCGRPPSSPRT